MARRILGASESPRRAIADLAAVCDYIIILSASRVLVSDDLDYVLASHRLLVGSSEGASDAPAGVVVVARTRSERQIELLVRVEQPVTDPSWQVFEPTLEEIVLAYLREQSTGTLSEVRAGQSVEGQQP